MQPSLLVDADNNHATIFWLELAHLCTVVPFSSNSAVFGPQHLKMTLGLFNQRYVEDKNISETSMDRILINKCVQQIKKKIT